MIPGYDQKLCFRLGLPRKRAVSGAVSGGFLWVSGGFRGFRPLSLAFFDAPTANTVVSYRFPEVSAAYAARITVDCQNWSYLRQNAPNKIESVTFPCLNQTGEGSRFRFFGPEYDDYDDDDGHHDDDDHDDDADDDDHHDDGGYDGDDDGDDGTTRATPLKI